MNTQKIIGQSLKRLEDNRFLQGQGRYVDDIQLPHMLHAAVLRSPHAHARIVEIDLSEARTAPGVAAIFTYADLVLPKREKHARLYP